ncbi:MAG TPA: HAD family hydrolase [Verrucomicrobiae bacterium]|nr:HAD family hydrolase [Verrucomicrobiae bacterium]
MKPRRAIFVDRDGTLIAEKNYLHKPEDVEFVKGAILALKKAVDAGFVIIMITNQAGVGRGYFTMEDVERVHEHLGKEMAMDDVSFVKIYVAPEAPGAPSRGRKPSPQFLFDARDEYDLDLSASYMIGDKLIDLECGWNAGVQKSILVRTGYGETLERVEKDRLRDAVIVDDVCAAVDWILSDVLER